MKGSATRSKALRRMRFRVISAKKRPTMLSQEAEVSLKRKWKRGCAFEPTLFGWCLMGGIVVNDQMEIEAGRGLIINQLEKAQELSVPMPRHIGADNLAVQHVERRE